MKNTKKWFTWCWVSFTSEVWLLLTLVGVAVRVCVRDAPTSRRLSNSVIL
ncbi:hypothetical protein [Chryseotalea sanaruensis]|nr:hypothetical protein [Chryseotalea sanaruensis]